MDPKDHPDWDADNGGLLVWIDGEGHLHIGDEELSWELTKDQAADIGARMIKYAAELEELKDNGELGDE